MKKYKHIFFDLDRTLWDFDKNSASTLCEIIDKFSLKDKIKSSARFVQKYSVLNDKLWVDYRSGKTSKNLLRKERFRLLLADYGLSSESLVSEISRYYLNIYPTKPALMRNARECCIYLSKKYPLYILSNGFYDVQLSKLVNSKISSCFKKVFTSDRIGYAKPNVKIFEYAISSVHAKKEECIMIGDDVEIDIKGAHNANIDQIFFNVSGESITSGATYEIQSLKELYTIL